MCSSDLSGREVLRRLVTQVSNPVRWDLCMQTMGDLGVTGVLEIPPAGTLTGLVKRALPGVETLALKTPDDLDEAWGFIERHAAASPIGDQPTWRLLISPVKGTFEQQVTAGVGESIPVNTAIGSIKTLRDTTPVVAPHGGVIVEWLVHDGDPVSPGQPLLRLHPEPQESFA